MHADDVMLELLKEDADISLALVMANHHPKVYLAKQYDAYSEGVTILGASHDEAALKVRLREYVDAGWYRVQRPIPTVHTDLDWRHLKERQFQQAYQEYEIRVSVDGDFLCWGIYRWQIVSIELDKELR